MRFYERSGLVNHLYAAGQRSAHKSRILDVYNHGGAGYAIGKDGLNGITSNGQKKYEPAAYVPNQPATK